MIKPAISLITTKQINQSNHQQQNPQIRPRTWMDPKSQQQQYTYQPQSNQQTNSSQIIIDKANDINLQNNFQLYKTKIDQALIRSAENIKKCKRSRSEEAPPNPIQKLRLNKFCSSKCSSMSQQNSTQSQKSTVFQFNPPNNPPNNPANNQSNEQDKKYQMLQKQYNNLNQQYKQLENEFQQFKEEFSELSLSYKQQTSELKKCQSRLKFQKQSDDLEMRKENEILKKQKAELESILKDLLFQQERNKFRKERGSSSFESDLDFKRQSIFELSTSNNHHPQQNSFMSASFITHTIEDDSTVTPSTPININVNLQQLSKSIDKSTDKSMDKSKDKKKDKKFTYQEIMKTQKFQSPIYEASRKKKNVKENKENKNQNK